MSLWKVVVSVSVFLCAFESSWAGDMETRYLSALRRGPWQYHIVEGTHPDAVLTASFNNTIEQNGWSFLEIRDVRENDPTTDEEIGYLAGIVEANLTASLMIMQWKNTMAGYCTHKPDLCSKIEDFILLNRDYIDVSSDSTTSRWYQIKLFLSQVTGLADGFQQAYGDELPDYAFMFFQMHGDLDDLEAAFSVPNFNSHSNRVPGSGSCSALVKVLPGNSDLLIGHNTWTSYANMLRIFKYYDFKYRISSDSTVLIPGHAQIFPSYPGRLYSGDDFYLISSGLVTMETSIENTNPELWKYITPTSILENMRTVVANRLATSGQEWSHYFTSDNSGTYNNQWTIVDYKKFVMGEENLKDGLLWVLEQMPNYIVSGDQTDMLRTQSYWASYNIPYNKDIYTMSGTGALAKQYGDWFSWKGAPRAKIFARNHTDVKDVQSLINLMRYNNFQHDNLSTCNCTPSYSGENGIAARSDLNPASGVYPFAALGHRIHGAIDMKVTSSKLFKGLYCFASSGPTSDQQPPFQWSTSGNPAGIPLGHPDKWNFETLLVNFVRSPGHT